MAEALRSSSQPKKTGVFHVSFLDDDAARRQTLNLGCVISTQNQTSNQRPDYMHRKI